jgi:hypothetical protein
VAHGIEPRISAPVARNSDQQTTEVVLKKLVSYLNVSTDPTTGNFEKYVKGNNSTTSSVPQYDYH